MSQHRVWVYGDNVNTDIIFPGKYTYTLKTPEDIAAHALEDLDPAFATNVQVGDIIVAGENWGCGSSREQAVTCLRYNDVPIIIAASFSGLYFRNCVNQGVHPIICPELHRFLQTGDIITIDDAHTTLTLPNGRIFPIAPLSPSVRAIFDAGGLLPMLQTRFQPTE